jgi:CubicO group peptidase (beta-lactamase class C family)
MARTTHVLQPQIRHRSNIVRALIGSELPNDEQHVYARNFEVPSGGGVGTARAIAHAYSVFATGGQELRLRSETLRSLAAPARPPTRGFYDECMLGDGVRFSLGFMKNSPAFPFGSEGSFGSPGSGGSIGFADPKAGIGYAYVTSQGGTALTEDPRDVALRRVVYSIIASTSGRSADACFPDALMPRLLETKSPPSPA